MAKNKNKGFSVIEIIIAIAILTLLLTPIVNQLAQTMSTNRRAKEQQYAVENGQYVMEYFQNSSFDVLQDTTLTSNNVYPTSPRTETERECEIIRIQPALDGSGSGSPQQTGTRVKYKIYRYELNQVELGSRKTKYDRYVVMDDLALQIMSTPVVWPDADPSGFRIKYNFTDAEKSTLESSGYVMREDGSYVQLAEDDDGEYAQMIVCEETGTFADKGITNPNEINLGNMHDLDSTQVAMITGNATNFDIQAEKELYAKAMDRLKDADIARWEVEIASTSEDHSYLLNFGYLTGLKKLTEIKIDEASDATGNYYMINVNVCYENSYLAATGNNDKLQYNVYSQKFYYDDSQPHKCPEIYFEYQPFATSYKTGEVLYSDQEDILIDNKVEGAKIYLYKPKWDMAHRYMYPNGAYDNEDLILKSADVFYTTNDSLDYESRTYNTNKVNIFISNANNPDDAAFKKTEIYTNLLVDVDGVKKVDVNVTGDSQFITNNQTIYSNSFYVSGAQRNVYEFDENDLMSIHDEANSEDRLYSMTVHLEPVDTIGNSIVLTGAKGVD